MKMMLLLITTLNLIKTSASKRKYAETETQSSIVKNIYDKTHAVNNSLYLSTNETLTSFSSAQANTKSSKLGKYEDYGNSFIDNDVYNLPKFSKEEFDQYLNGILKIYNSNNYQDYAQDKTQIIGVQNTFPQSKSSFNDFNNKIDNGLNDQQNYSIHKENMLSTCSFQDYAQEKTQVKDVQNTFPQSNSSFNDYNNKFENGSNDQQNYKIHKENMSSTCSFQDYAQDKTHVKGVRNTFLQSNSSVNNYNNKNENGRYDQQNHSIHKEYVVPVCSTFDNQTDDLQTTVAVETSSTSTIYKKLKEYIYSYIDKNIAQSYSSSHLKRLKIIERVYGIFDKYIPDPLIYYTVFNHPYYKKILNDLISIYLSFDKSSIFNKKTCEKFLNDFNSKIFYSFYSTKLRDQLGFLISDQKNLVFFSEIMELYKYIGDIPEILFLFSLFDEKSFKKVTFVLHLIIMFADNIKNIKENRVFILCMIFKAIDVFYNGSFNIFLIPFYELKCQKDLYDLNFFSWDFNAYKRRDLSVRKSLTIISLINDKKYLKIVFLIYVYQHMIFNKYYEVGSEGIKLYQDFIDKITQPSECIACLLKEYLSMVQKCIKDKL